MTTQAHQLTLYGSLVSNVTDTLIFCELQAHSQPSMTKLQPPKTSGRKQSGYALVQGKQEKQYPLH